MSESGPSGASPLAAQTARLLAVVTDLVDGWGAHPAASAAAGGGETPPAGESARASSPPECQWCPLCQLIALVRGDRPELAQPLADAATAAVAALRAVIDAAAPANTGGADRSSPQVQRIDLGGSG